MRCWEHVERYPRVALLVCMGNGNEIKGRKMLDEKEWSNCIGCFFYCSTLVFVLSRLVVVRIAMSMLNEKSQLYQVDVFILVCISDEARGCT